MDKKDMKDKKIVNFIMKIFWIFVIGSIFGFVAEILYISVYTRTIEVRKGLIYGPFIQVYGIGALAYHFLTAKVKSPKEAFFYGMLMGGIIEYIFSFFQEILWESVSWDYSNMFLNINGRTSLTYAVYWGIIAVIYLKVVNPIFKKIEPLIYKKSIRICTYIFMVFMTFDIAISCMAVSRQVERRKKISADNGISQFLDEYYPDELLDKIYFNRRDI